MSTVIKSGDQNPALVKRLETVSVSDHLAEARLVVDAARRQAREILANTAREADELRESASKQGFEAGFKRGYAAGNEKGHESALAEARSRFDDEQAQLVQTLHGLVDQYEQMKRDLSIAAKHDTLDFAFRVAKRVTKLVGVLNRDAARANLDVALQRVGSVIDITIRVHPTDLESIERFARGFQSRIGESTHISILGDESVSPGGCLLSTPDSDVDATLDTQIEQIAQLIAGRDEGRS